MKENLNLRLGTEIKDKNKDQENLNYKLAAQDALNTVAILEGLAGFKSYSDEQFYEKVKNYDLKKFEEYHALRGLVINEEEFDAKYPGFVARFNRLIEKLKAGDISREEISFEISSLRNEVNEAIAA